MKKYRATWVSRQESRIWCCDFSGFGDDRAALAAEIEVSAATIRAQLENTLLVAVYLHKPTLTPELHGFLEMLAQPEKNPIHKLAIIGVSGFERFWLKTWQGVIWPKKAAFFLDYEQAKAWLVGEVS